MRVPSSTALALAAVLLAASASAAPAQSQSGADAPSDTPAFSRTPSNRDIRGVFPNEALRRGIDGEVVLRCRVGATRLVTDCTILSETPEGIGFGQAALAVTPQFQVREGGARAGQIIRVPVRFNTNRSGFVRETGEALVLNPPWAQAPTRAEVAAASPERAGVATLRCEVLNDGRLRRCDVIRENPRFAGLRGAALSLADRFRMQVPPGTNTQGVFVDVPVALSRTPGERLDRVPFAVTPASEDIRAALDPLARAAPDRRVRVVADCQIGPDAALTDCQARGGAAEAQAAAAPLFSHFVARRWTDDGQATVGARATVALSYTAD